MIARMLAAELASRKQSPMLLRQDAPDAGGIDAARCGRRRRVLDPLRRHPRRVPSHVLLPVPVGTATIIREQMRVPILAGIASQVTPSVVPVWITWFNGGSGMLDFTSRFGADFTGDPTTTRIAPLLARDVASSLDATQLQALAAAPRPARRCRCCPRSRRATRPTRRAAGDHGARC